MPSIVSIDMSQIDPLFTSLNKLQYEGMEKPVSDASKKLAFKLKQNVLQGQDPKGNQYSTIKEVTLDMPIKREGAYADQRIRKEVSTNRIAMNVTGNSANSISVKRENYKEYTVGVDGERANLVFESNARDIGNSPKPKRDPLGLSINAPTDEEFNIVADEVEYAVDAVINGL